MIAYRGMGLPEGALKDYETRLESGEVFSFPGFTSTSKDKNVAFEFAYDYGVEVSGSIPIVLMMRCSDVF